MAEYDGIDNVRNDSVLANNRRPERNKKFQVTLTNSTAEVGEKTTATVTILDLD